jgi:membrane protease YdiL (CAAX protease family)
MGFGEEFGWRGFMFPELYKIEPWIAFIIGGLIWFGWHIPLIFIFPQTQSFTIMQQAVNMIILATGSIFSYAFLAYVYIKTENIFVVSFAHIVINNASSSFSYFVVIDNQILANIALTVTMAVVIGILYYFKELKIFKNYFNQHIPATTDNKKN